MSKDPTGIILVLVGVLFWIKPFMVWLITLQNKLRGTQTNITNITVWYYRILGIIMIGAGLFVMLFVTR